LFDSDTTVCTNEADTFSQCFSSRLIQRRDQEFDQYWRSLYTCHSPIQTGQMKSISTETRSRIDYCLIGSTYGARQKITTATGAPQI
jgi:hypothetical protein